MKRNAELEAAKKKWYAELAKTGFKDIEHDESSPYVKDHHLRIRRRVRRGWRSGGEALFDLLNDYISGAIASRRSERVNVMLFSKGMPAGEIAKRFGVTRRLVEKQVYGIMARVRELANDPETQSGFEQADASSEDESGDQEGNEPLNLSRSSDER